MTCTISVSYTHLDVYKRQTKSAHDFEDQLSGTAGTITDAAVANANADTDTPAATAPADPAAAASPAISPNAAAAQAKPAPMGNSPYTVQ